MVFLRFLPQSLFDIIQYLSKQENSNKYPNLKTLMELYTKEEKKSKRNRKERKKEKKKQPRTESPSTIPHT